MIEIRIRCDLCDKDSGERNTGRPLKAHTLRQRLEQKGWVCGWDRGPYHPKPRTVDVCPECRRSLK